MVNRLTEASNEMAQIETTLTMIRQKNAAFSRLSEVERDILFSMLLAKQAILSTEVSTLLRPIIQPNRGG